MQGGRGSVIAREPLEDPGISQFCPRMSSDGEVIGLARTKFIGNRYIHTGRRCLGRYEVVDVVIEGGETRFNSVKNGVNTIGGDEGFVAIHDGVRPLVSKRLIKDVFEAADSMEMPFP